MFLKRNILFTKDTTQEYLVNERKYMNQKNALADYSSFSLCSLIRIDEGVIAS